MPKVWIHHPQGLLRVAYSEIGEGREVLLVHGMGGSLETLRPLQVILGRTHRAIAVDLPGFGRSDLPRRPQSLPEFRDALLALRGPLLRGPAHLFGHSFGGLIASLAAEKAPLEWLSLALASPAGFTGNLRAFPDLPMPYAVKRAAVLWLTSGRRAERMLRTVLRDPGKLSLPMRRVLQRSYRSAREMLRLGPEPWPQDLPQRVAALKMPVIAIWGAEDRTFPLEEARAYAPDLPISVIPGADHLVPIEAPEACAAVLERFYGDVPRA